MSFYYFYRMASPLFTVSVISQNPGLLCLHTVLGPSDLCLHDNKLSLFFTPMTYLIAVWGYRTRDSTDALDVKVH